MRLVQGSFGTYHCLSSHLLVEFCTQLSLPRDSFPDLLLPFTPSDYPAALWPKPWVGCEELTSASLSYSPNADRAFQLRLSSACALLPAENADDDC